VSRTGGELLVRGLEAAGVEVVFGLPGVHNLPIWRALAESRIRLVGVRHEQSAAHPADGDPRARGRRGGALTTTGPGAANTLAATGEAWASRSPILVIATDIAKAVRRRGVYRGALHETTDQAGMFAPIVKGSFRVEAAESLGDAVVLAARTALAAPSRPVYMEVPTDVLSEPAGAVEPSETTTGASPVAPTAGDLDAAAEAIARAERPLVWAGGGALRADAGEAVGELAERLAAPVITTYMARGLLAPEHPCAVGPPPHVRPVGELWDEADVVIAIGSDLDGMMTQSWTMPAPERLVAVNVDPEDASKNYQPDLLLAADARLAADALARLIEPRGGIDDLRARLQGIRERVRNELASGEPAALEMLDTMAAALPADAVLVCDMCIPGYWLGGFHSVPAPRKLAYPMGWGTLGFGFPASLGAALAGAGPAVSVSGDGGFLYACAELATAAQEGIPLTAVIVDDGGYGMLRFDQRSSGQPTFGVDLDSPDFVMLAKSFGVQAEQTDGLGEQFGEALRRHIDMNTPSVLVTHAELNPPPNTSPRWYRKVGRR
jgi:thiamine pyrophosphate-dependent acetolactate synthase large subunit-like protein